MSPRRDLPVLLAAVLTGLALWEAMADSVTEQAPTLVPLLLALAATVPVAFLLSHTLTVLTTCVAATALALLTADRPPVASMVAVACAAGVVAVRLLRRARSEAGHRAAARTSVSESLVEFAARGERVRIARELHDVVAHHLSMISVQADAARLTTPGMPDLGARRLAAIGDTARAALTEMRRLVGVLREDAPESESRLPQPGLAELTALVDEARAATGSSMRLIVSGPVAALDPGVQLTTYRIVQEALTNARRHAPGAAVDVVLHYDVDTLRVRVRDNGPAGAGPATPGRTGHGLVGMRERVAMLGGTLHAGPAPGCGFLVEADLPAVTP